MGPNHTHPESRFCRCLYPISKAGWQGGPPEKKYHLKPGLNQRDRTAGGGVLEFIPTGSQATVSTGGAFVCPSYYTSRFIRWAMGRLFLCKYDDYDPYHICRQLGWKVRIITPRSARATHNTTAIRTGGRAWRAGACRAHLLWSALWPSRRSCVVVWLRRHAPAGALRPCACGPREGRVRTLPTRSRTLPTRSRRAGARGRRRARRAPRRR